LFVLPQMHARHAIVEETHVNAGAEEDTLYSGLHMEVLALVGTAASAVLG
jgi:hypothetical protein